MFEYDCPIELPSILAYNLRIRPFINKITIKTYSPELVFKKESVPRFRLLTTPIKELSSERKNKFCCPLNTKSSSSIKEKFSPINKKFSPINKNFSPNNKKFSPNNKKFGPYYKKFGQI